MLLFAHLVGIGWDDNRYSLTAMMNGAAHKPFVYRQLVPTLANIATNGDSAPSQQRAIAAAIITIFFILYLFAFKWLAATFNVNTILPALAGLPLLMANNNHIYDLSTLALFTFAYAALANKRLILYAALYPLLVLNKETALLLTLFVFIVERNIKLTIYELTTYAAIRAALMWLYRDNPGGVIEFHLFTNAVDWILQAQTSIAYAALIILLVWRLSITINHKPAFIRAALYTLTPTLAVLFFLFGYNYELRVFYEVYPIVALSVL